MDDLKQLTDEEVVEIVRSKNRDLYAVIMERYKDKLWRYAKNLIGDNDLANHIVQDSFVKAFINLKGFNAKQKFSSWIYRIVHNEVINVVKKRRREIPLPDNIDFSSDDDQEKDFEKKEIADQIEKCLSSIPLIYSEPLSLYYIDGQSYEEISDILRLPIGTVSIRLSRAKKLMKKICQQN